MNIEKERIRKFRIVRNCENFSDLDCSRLSKRLRICRAHFLILVRGIKICWWRLHKTASEVDCTTQNGQASYALFLQLASCAHLLYCTAILAHYNTSLFFRETLKLGIRRKRMRKCLLILSFILDGLRLPVPYNFFFSKFVYCKNITHVGIFTFSARYRS